MNATRFAQIALVGAIGLTAVLVALDGQRGVETAPSCAVCGSHDVTTARKPGGWLNGVGQVVVETHCYGCDWKTIAPPAPATDADIAGWREAGTLPAAASETGQLEITLPTPGER